MAGGWHGFSTSIDARARIAYFMVPRDEFHFLHQRPACVHDERHERQQVLPPATDVIGPNGFARTKSPQYFCRWRISRANVRCDRMTISRTLVLRMALAIAVGFWGPARAAEDTVALPSEADTTLIETAPDNNLGGADFFNAGTAGNGNRNRALLLFNPVELIPAGAVITSAQLSLTVVRQPNSGLQNSTFSLRRVFQSWNEGAQNWGEQGPGQGLPAEMGEATWNHRFSGGTLWSQPGGQAGVDFSTTLSSTAF